MWRKVRDLGHNQITCSVCSEVPDSKCFECGDLYCSVQWTGHPGCFHKMHEKGNRINHKKKSYTVLKEYLEEIQSQHEEMEHWERKINRKKAREKKEDLHKVVLRKKQKREREERIQREAFIEF